MVYLFLYFFKEEHRGIELLGVLYGCDQDRVPGATFRMGGIFELLWHFWVR